MELGPRNEDIERAHVSSQDSLLLVVTPGRGSMTPSSKSRFRTQNRPTKRQKVHASNDHLEDSSFQPPKSKTKSTPIKSTRSLRSAGSVPVRRQQATPPPAKKNRKKKTFYIGIDFGTTFSKISYLCYDVEDKEFTALSSDVKSIENWPMSSLSGSKKQVYSLSWYPNLPRVQNSRVGRGYSSSHSDSETDSSDTDSEDDVEVVRVANVLNWSSNDAPGQPDIQNIPYAGRDTEDSPRYIWGNEVFYRQYRFGTSRKLDRLMDRPKLFLLSSDHTQYHRDALRPRLKGLIRSGTITGNGNKAGYAMQDVRDVLMNFFVQLLLHTKRELQREEGYTEDCSVSLSWAIPVVFNGY